MCTTIDTPESTSPLQGGSGTCHKFQGEEPLTRSPVVDVKNGFIRNQQERPLREPISVCNIPIISASSMKHG